MIMGWYTVGYVHVQQLVICYKLTCDCVKIHHNRCVHVFEKRGAKMFYVSQKVATWQLFVKLTKPSDTAEIICQVFSMFI